MAFTQTQLTGSFISQTGQPASGTVTFTLTAAMENANQIVAPGPIRVTLNGSGSFTVTLLANDDAATVPQGVQYGVTEEIDGCEPRDYFITVPSAISPVDLSTLMPGQTGWT